MSTKRAKLSIVKTETKPVVAGQVMKKEKCLDPDCKQDATTDGFCRLHFIKQIAFKSEALRHDRVGKSRKSELDLSNSELAINPFVAHSTDHSLKKVAEVDMDWGHFDDGDDFENSKAQPSIVTSITRALELDRKLKKTGND